MIGDAGSTQERKEVDDVEEEASEDTLVSEDNEDDDNIGDISVEINVEELVAKIEASGSDDASRKREIRRRLEDLQERRSNNEDLDSTYDFNLDDDL